LRVNPTPHRTGEGGGGGGGGVRVVPIGGDNGGG